MTTPPGQIANPEVAPAHALWVELETRITTRRLHYRSGDEETAAESVHSVFKTVRDLVTKHPDARAFADVATTMINVVIRPYTARWHGWMTQDRENKEPKLRFRDEQVRRMFRAELQHLQGEIDAYLQMLERLAQADARSWPVAREQAMLDGLGPELSARLRRDRDAAGPAADLGPDLEAGIGTQVHIANGVTVAEINQWEHDALAARRALRKGAAAGDGTRPKPILNATGLALSGGGIRSATFSLGVVQELVKRGVFQQFDYLSTVSGGGYLGGFLSCALGTRAAQTESKPPSDTGTPPGKGTTSGPPDAITKKTNEVFHEQHGIESGLLRHLRNNSKYLLNGGRLAQLRIVGLLFSGLAWNLLIVVPLPMFAALAMSYVPPGFFAAVLPVVVLYLAIAFGLSWLLIPGIELLTHGKPPESEGARFRSSWETFTIALGVSLTTVGVVALLPALCRGYEWLRRFLDQRGLVEWLPTSVTGASSALLTVAISWLAPRWPRLRTLLVKLFILSGPLLFLFVFLLVANRLGVGRDDGSQWNPWWVLGATTALATWGWSCVDINTLAPHRYYRDRLCECYLAQQAGGPQAPIQVLKQVKLGHLGRHPAAPYHLINTTLNVPTSRNKDLRGRASDFFLVSRHVCGSPLTGYAETEHMERVDPHFDLGTAMAVSGAAASTSMGWRSLPNFRFLMTLFNVRLGYWLRRPGVRTRRLFDGPGPWYFFREMLGAMDESCRYLNLSDGGHIENLAVYELLRRRCKFIVCVDGGCEPGMECTDLIRLQRYAEIDLGIGMHYDIADLRLGANQLSRAHAILVKIDYGRGATDAPATSSRQLGWMLYVKLAMTGTEPVYVKDYKRENPDFPHQSTGDQLFDEAQFEAYRALGANAMAGMFRDEILGSLPEAGTEEMTMESWFHALANALLPDNDEAWLPEP